MNDYCNLSLVMKHEIPSAVFVVLTKKKAFPSVPGKAFNKILFKNSRGSLFSKGVL